jgi:hypothetical protein
MTQDLYCSNATYILTENFFLINTYTFGFFLFIVCSLSYYNSILNQNLNIVINELLKVKRSGSPIIESSSESSSESESESGSGDGTSFEVNGEVYELTN